jgi:transcription-repair coupling factor (superfamily II helicase)
MNWLSFTRLLQQSPPFSLNPEKFEQERYCFSIYNAVGAAASLAIAEIIHKTPGKLLIIAKSEAQLEHVQEDLYTLLEPEQSKRLLLFPDTAVLPYEKISPSIDQIGEQIQVLNLLMEDHAIVLAPYYALFNPVIDPIDLQAHSMTLSLEQTLKVDDLLQTLIHWGYNHEVSVERVGDLKVKGGIVDIFSPSAKYPVRIEWLGRTISSMRFFDPSTQLSIDKIAQFKILPVTHVVVNPEQFRKTVLAIREWMKQKKLQPSPRILDDLEKLEQGIIFSGIEHYLPFLRTRECTILDYFDSSSPTVWLHKEEFSQSMASLTQEITEIRSIEKEKHEVLPFPFEAFVEENKQKLLQRKRHWELEALPLAVSTASHYALPVRYMDTVVQKDLKTTVDQYLARQGKLMIVSKQKKRVLEILATLGVDLLNPDLIIHDAHLSRGFSAPELKTALLTDLELFGWKRPHKTIKRFKEGIPIKSVDDLKLGDILSHYSYGIGIYRGLTVVKDAEGKQKEFLLMEYAKGDKLYIPPERIHMVNKYIGDPENTQLNSLGSADWERARTKAKKGAEELAQELLELYAKREVSKGIPFAHDTPWQEEMEALFPYEETIDQMQAIHDVKQDMESPQIMDRIVTGDVGYGKTEVAIRAAFKAIMDGFQVALVVPTTILANQHYENFKERYAPYPIQLGCLSRLISSKKQKETLSGLEKGSVEMVIGTHRMFSKDIAFKNLGLLIIDEEHKFGVKHKEQIRKIKENVDVLTLSATPIPRTLSMSMSGIKEISRIDTPPEGRKPVKTYVMPYDEEVLQQAIRFELARNGQVYYVHNRIQDILRIRDNLLKMLPEINIGVAHGQMKGDTIDGVITDFLTGKLNVLLCTTIIESGIDIATVNTLIVDDSEFLGLAQMYQLRGRVGRSHRRAYAYFFYDPKRASQYKAEARLDAIREYVELGSGLKIAFRDMEIRGAGNFLGPEQHGHIRSVGYHMYIQLLKEAIEDLRFKKGVGPEPIDLPEFPLSGYIPDTFMKDEGERLAIYQELVTIKNRNSLSNLVKDLKDQYGTFPEEMDEFVHNLDLRIQAYEKGLSSVKIEDIFIHFNFDFQHHRFKMEAKSLSQLVAQFGNYIRFKPEAIMIRKSKTDLMQIIEGVLKCL